jgi:hypothetical protein
VSVVIIAVVSNPVAKYCKLIYYDKLHQIDHHCIIHIVLVLQLLVSRSLKSLIYFITYIQKVLMTEVEQHWAWLVLGWVTAWEHHMPLAFHLGHEADHSLPSSAEVKECVELYLNSPITPS